MAAPIVRTGAPWHAGAFCRRCGAPARPESPAGSCGHGDSAPWAALTERERWQARWRLIRTAKAQRGLAKGL
ncbi:MAG: hypothetical protein H0Z37_00555 [Firmicutes bacterium]|nr:hypothetical protein [Bacillota bacterium]